MCVCVCVCVCVKGNDLSGICLHDAKYIYRKVVLSLTHNQSKVLTHLFLKTGLCLNISNRFLNKYIFAANNVYAQIDHYIITILTFVLFYRLYYYYKTLK